MNTRIGCHTKALRERLDADSAGRWPNDYPTAAGNELKELHDCTFWKHWCDEAKQGRRPAVADLQNARVEVIDLLFFRVSMAQCVGPYAGYVQELYCKRLKANQQRQDDGYSMNGKDDVDNQKITVDR